MKTIWYSSEGGMHPLEVDSTEVTDADCAFPARAMDLMPEYSHIPGDRVKPNARLSGGPA